MLKHWSNQNQDGLLEAGKHFIKQSDFLEIRNYINKLRNLCQQNDITSSFENYVTKDKIPSFQSYIDNLVSFPESYGAPYQTAPFRADWICTKSGAHNNKLVKLSDSVTSVELHKLFSDTGNWSEYNFTKKRIRAQHMNELRQALSLLTRGCWQHYVGFYSAMSSRDPDTTISGGNIKLADGAKQKAIGASFLINGSKLGLHNVTIRPESSIVLQADNNVNVKLYHCNTSEELLNDYPTWNKLAPAKNISWNSPGASSSSDASLIETCTLQAGVPKTISNSTVQNILQKIVNGGSRYFILSPESQCNSTAVSAVVNAIFDINI